MTISLSTGRRGAEAHELHPVLQAAARWCRKLLRAQRRLPSDLQRPVNYRARTKYQEGAGNKHNDAVSAGGLGVEGGNLVLNLLEGQALESRNQYWNISFILTPMGQDLGLTNAELLSDGTDTLDRAGLEGKHRLVTLLVDNCY